MNVAKICSILVLITSSPDLNFEYLLIHIFLLIYFYYKIIILYVYVLIYSVMYLNIPILTSLHRLQYSTIDFSLRAL